MSITAYLDNCERALKELPGVHKVIRFAGQLDESDLKSMNLSNSGATVLITGVGGPTSRNPMGSVDCDVGFGAYVVASDDRGTIGRSSKAEEIAIDIVNKVNEESCQWAADRRTKEPDLLEVAEINNPASSGTRYAIWSVLWVQRVVLKNACKQ